MCGIVGLFIKNPALQPELGRLTSLMLKTMTERGPDSAGFAVYGSSASGQRKMTVRGISADNIGDFEAGFLKAAGGSANVAKHQDHVVLTYASDLEPAIRAFVNGFGHGVHFASSGESIELYKGVGLPEEVAARFDLEKMQGTHAIGHTRMATESAVTIAGAHPFSTGPDQCLVHNGSLSNHNTLRRRLVNEGLTFETENDSEVAAGYLSWRLSQGDKLDQALESSLKELDGFYTFVVGTREGFAVLRDPVACKPAVMAETDDYVAFASEYRAFADLPGIENAKVFEPEPQRVYHWEHAA
ncbi:glutamine amidotransferase [Acetobacter aceti NRIC 0242]|uniref:Amidophosphoribosyltransferase n=1 Tax=Acetobacter aceti NBRC 14818 TaxID=887700 RepID=A0AB33IHH4_ACEAC|nr:glutamine amidotransferase family protein [Acetobacter aceti]TCS28392.1 N-methylglutamate synthase subunit A [Acetobacter aceti NBRC 14818]BCK76329.1 amidophosphoribosyltransferase [Acetobacter aceti NBRC 14818]GAN58916.1 glutamine amidotransferase [Acetobacter aceti NBRC 14818]GBO80539.1 glutamine amidotransferase [Acetobacter aceti NRIC 0242]